MIFYRSKEEYKNKSIRELIKERQKIMNHIINMENEDILADKYKEEGIGMCPSPATVWKVTCEDLVMITNLLQEKTMYKNDAEIKDDLDKIGDN